MNSSFKYRVIKAYCIVFYALMIYKWLNGFLLYQLQPSFFYTRQDLATWVFMQTGLHQWLLNNPFGWILFDALFYISPFLLFLANKTKKLETPAAIAMLVINWCYVQCYTLYPSNSIEGHTAWLLFPFIFLTRQGQTFLLLYEAVRYFFLYFFVSAAIWMFAQGGIFHVHEMSGILLYQHQQLLTNSPDYWHTRFILYLIQHRFLSYTLYLSATILELLFIVGFFTKKYDRMLLILFIIFLIADNFIMRIPYFEVAALALPLFIKNKITANTNIRIY